MLFTTGLGAGAVCGGQAEVEELLELLLLLLLLLEGIDFGFVRATSPVFRWAVPALPRRSRRNARKAPANSSSLLAA